LYIIFAVEFFVLMSYSFPSPFLPMLIQSMGKFTDREAAFWTGIASAIMGVTLFITAPVWGIIADRWGRKPMVIRAMFGITAVSVAMAVVPNVYWLVILRAITGLFGGSMAAASALVASTTPREKIPYAMGILMMAIFGGSAFGPLIGGLMADALGYRSIFYVVAAVYFVGGLIVLFFAKENFVPVPREQLATFNKLGKLVKSPQILPLLMVLCVLAIGPSMLSPIIPLFIQQLRAKSAASAAGLAMGLMGVVAAISSIIAGRMGTRVDLKKMLIWGCFCTGVLYLPPVFATTVFWFILLMALSGLFNGGIMVPSNSLIALSVSQTEQGMAYGLQQSANSLGSGLGPLLGGVLASTLGLKSVFPVSAALFIIAGVLVIKLLPGLSRARVPESIVVSGQSGK
jgi:DHA1 family multidrug resistance protein-like MFS transporter